LKSSREQRHQRHYKESRKDGSLPGERRRPESQAGRRYLPLVYGDFSQSTGIADSAYTPATRQWFLRNPTKKEWLGDEKVSRYEGLRNKLKTAKAEEAQRKILMEYIEVVKANVIKE
jgi:hypothetical protein